MKETIKLEQFSASRLREGDALQLVMSGTADIAALAPLNDFLSSVFEETRTSATREVSVDLRDLEFMNSSCFKAFIVWLTRVADMEKASQYKVRFLGSATRHWQKRSLAALSCFAADLVKIEM